MTVSNAGPLDLQRIDPTRNMRRFYILGIQPTLFGGASVMRNWGRIGSAGQSKIETFDVPLHALSEFARMERVKRRKGYVVASDRF